MASVVPFLVIGFVASAIRSMSSRPKPEHRVPADVHYYHEGPRLKDLRVQASSYGKVIPLVYGTVRIAGNVIWSRSLNEQILKATDVSGDADTTGLTYRHSTNYAYTATLAIALCKGKITGVSRIWAESAVLDLSKLKFKLYLGDEEQKADPTIVSFEGEDRTPAYRSLAYIVIEDFPLAEFHNRIPNFTFEVSRHLRLRDTLESKITSIAFGQGIGEYLYDTVVQEKSEGEFKNGVFAQRGVGRILNQNNDGNKADALVGLANMQSALPNVESISLPVYWILNIRDGSVKPGVDFQNSYFKPNEWKVANYTRKTACPVPHGLSTPSDSSILRMARQLKARDGKVMLYPKLLYHDPETSQFMDHVDNFKFDSQQYTAFIEHYATLSSKDVFLRDQIEAFVVAGGGFMSSAARMADSTRKQPTHIPYFKELANTVRKTLPKAKLVFAAFAHLYHSFDKWYYLDELWSSSDVDVVGIEGYFPLSVSSGPLTYEQVIQGWQSGEGWDGLPEAFAWKNIRYWHENFHINPDGKQTAWQPKMKPVWITELAFGSVDGCTNEPWVFSSPYNTRYPKGSSGRTNFAAQRIALEGSLAYLNTQEFIKKKFVSFWDPRPYPYYPSLTDRWLQPYTWKKDASLQGKLGLTRLSSIVQELLQEVGLNAEMCDATRLDDMVSGFVVSKRQSVRTSLEQLASAYFFDAVETNGVLAFTKRGGASCATIDSSEFIVQEGSEPADSFVITRAQELELARSIDVIYINAAQSYDNGSANAQRQTVDALNSVSISLPLVLSSQEAQRIADVTLLQTWITRTQYKFSLPPKYMWLKPTDVITVHKHVEQDSAQNKRSGIDHVHQMRILAVKLMPNGVQEISAVAEDVSSYKHYRESNETAPQFSLPHPTPKTQLVLLDLPAIKENDGAHLSCAVVAETAGWRGAALYAAACGSDSSGTCDADCAYQGQILEQATLGTVLAFNSSPTSGWNCAMANTWDEHTRIEVVLMHGELFSTTGESVLAGANLCVIGDELLQFQKAEFIRDHHYRLSKLLRGRKGTESFINTHTAGERFVLINSAIVKIPVPLSCWGAPRQYKAVTFGDHPHNTEAVEFTYNARALKPYAPCHVKVVREASGDIVVSWVRRTRVNGEWLSFVDAPVSEEAERYEVDIVVGDRVKRTIVELTSPSAIYTKVQQLEDFGETSARITFNVYQLSALVGRGYAGTFRLWLSD